MPPSRVSQRGLTLLEMLIVLTIIAATLSLATPSLGSFVHEFRLQHYSRGLLGAVNFARSEAILRNTSVSVCPSSMARSGEPECADTYSQGWMVFVNADRDREVDAGEDEVLRVGPALPTGYRIANRAGTAAASGLISYRSDGSARRNLTLQICPPDQQTAPLSVVLNIVGRARLERNWGVCESGL